MEKSGSFSQSGITREQAGAETPNQTGFNASLRQQTVADDAHYHTEKLGLGGHGTHEGWIKAEEAGAASTAVISAEARHKIIAVAAYYLAEKRGFAGHGAYEDWMKAEAEIDAMLHGRS
jgi:hypothetical protein